MRKIFGPVQKMKAIKLRLARTSDPKQSFWEDRREYGHQVYQDNEEELEDEDEGPREDEGLEDLRRLEIYESGSTRHRIAVLVLKQHGHLRVIDRRLHTLVNRKWNNI